VPLMEGKWRWRGAHYGGVRRQRGTVAMCHGDARGRRRRELGCSRSSGVEDTLA
jgi:hypothetical protein